MQHAHEHGLWHVGDLPHAATVGQLLQIHSRLAAAAQPFACLRLHVTLDCAQPEFL